MQNSLSISKRFLTSGSFQKRSLPNSRIRVPSVVNWVSSRSTRVDTTYSRRRYSRSLGRQVLVKSILGGNVRGMAEIMDREDAGVGNGKGLRFVDIGINLTDPVFRGEYHGTQRHPSDLEDVITRAKEAGCKKLLVTGSDISESRKAVELSKQYPGLIYNTIGVHPCSCSQFESYEGGPEKMLEDLKILAEDAKEGGWCVAFGEFGLDYDRLEHCPAPLQQKYFTAQLQIATQLSLPLFLHSRAAAADFRTLLAPHLPKLPKRGVVHSFTGSMEEMLELVEDGWSIGINGCSLKTQENCEVVKAVPLESLMLETDGPWCEIRPSHHSSQYLSDLPAPPPPPKNKPNKNQNQDSATSSNSTSSTSLAPNPDHLFPTYPSVKKEKQVPGSLIKGRNEPCMIGRVAWAVAKIKEVDIQVVVDAAWENSVGMFGLGGAE